jgi:hypothetical protein
MLFTWRLQLCFWLFMFRHLFFVSHCVAANRPLTTHVVRARVITFFYSDVTECGAEDNTTRSVMEFSSSREQLFYSTVSLSENSSTVAAI